MPIDARAAQGIFQGAGAGRRGGLFHPCGDLWAKIVAIGRAKVAAVDPATGEHPFAGHEVVALVAPPHQEARLFRIAPHDDQGGRILGPHDLLVFSAHGPVRARVVIGVEFRFGHVPSLGRL